MWSMDSQNKQGRFGLPSSDQRNSRNFLCAQHQILRWWNSVAETTTTDRKEKKDREWEFIRNSARTIMTSFFLSRQPIDPVDCVENRCGAWWTGVVEDSSGAENPTSTRIFCRLTVWFNSAPFLFNSPSFNSKVQIKVTPSHIVHHLRPVAPYNVILKTFNSVGELLLRLNLQFGFFRTFRPCFN